MKKENWIWMGHPGHLIVSRYCRFFLNTYIGKYIVSTVGEYFPPEGVREIFAKSRGETIEGMGDAREADYLRKMGFEELHPGGYLYETMVFEARRDKNSDCCPWVQKRGGDKDSRSYKTAYEALQGHMQLCQKWSEKTG